MSSAMDKLRARLAAAAAKKPTESQVQLCEARPSNESTESTDSPETTEYTSVVTTEGLEGQAIAFKNMLLELEDKLNNRVEGFSYLLRDIHQHLRKDPEVVTVLSDEEIGLVVRGLKTMTGTILGTTAAAKKTGGRAKKSMPVTADML